MKLSGLKKTFSLHKYNRFLEENPEEECFPCAVILRSQAPFSGALTCMFAYSNMNKKNLNRSKNVKKPGQKVVQLQKNMNVM